MTPTTTGLDKESAKALFRAICRTPYQREVEGEVTATMRAMPWWPLTREEEEEIINEVAEAMTEADRGADDDERI